MHRQIKLFTQILCIFSITVGAFWIFIGLLPGLDSLFIFGLAMIAFALVLFLIYRII